jgi:hypothetical protein
VKSTYSMTHLPSSWKNTLYKIICTTTLLTIPVCILTAQVTPNWKHKEELYSFLQYPSDSIYIQDRATLEELPEANCTKTEVRYHTLTSKAELIQIAIKSKPFIASHHHIKLTDTTYSISKGKKKPETVIVLNQIDSLKAIGINKNIPESEVASFIILRNNKKLVIPVKAYKDLYNIHFCADHKKPEVYIHPKSKCLYVYLHGSDGQNSYSVKFIFNQTGYVTRIVNTHPCLADFDFIDGFGECE